MEARTTFRGAKISKSLVAVVFALLVALAIGGTGGYFIKALSVPASTIGSRLAQTQVSAIADAAPRSQRGGLQTMEGTQASKSVGGNQARHGGVQLP